MLITRKNINYLFSMDNCFVKTSESYKNLTNLLKKFSEFPPRRLNLLHRIATLSMYDVIAERYNLESQEL